MGDETNSVDKRVGANVARFRTAKGMSQADLATWLTTLGGLPNMHQQTIAKIEKGTRSLKYMEAIKIAEALFVDVYDLSAGHNEATMAAWLVESLERVRRTGGELEDVAERLAGDLVSLAGWLRRHREEKLPVDQTSAPEGESASGYIERQAVDELDINWGLTVNQRIHLAMRRQPYLAEIRPEFDAPTYAEVLKRVSESPVIGIGEIDATDA